MAKTKTKETNVNVADFVMSFAETDQRKKDSFDLIKLMEDASGFKAKMWGPSIIGFGLYHYKYESGHEGDAPMIGFSPRKAAISLYVFTGLQEHKHLLSKLGKFTMGKACIYVKKLDDIDQNQLKVIIKASIKYLEKKYGKK